MTYTFDEDSLIKLLEEIQEDALYARGNSFKCYFKNREDFIEEIKCYCEKSVDKSQKKS